MEGHTAPQPSDKDEEENHSCIKPWQARAWVQGTRPDAVASEAPCHDLPRSDDTLSGVAGRACEKPQELEELAGDDSSDAQVHKRRRVISAEGEYRRFSRILTVDLSKTSEGSICSFAWSVLDDVMSREHCCFIFGNVDQAKMESVQRAYHFVLANRQRLLERYKVPFKVDLETQCVGVEFPGEDVPIGGPSGCAVLATSLAALVMGVELGEAWLVAAGLNLNGDLHPVGGVQRKLAAASLRMRHCDILKGVICAEDHVMKGQGESAEVGGEEKRLHEVKWCKDGRAWKRSGKCFRTSSDGRLRVRGCGTIWQVLDQLLLKTGDIQKLSQWQRSPPSHLIQPTVALVKSMFQPKLKKTGCMLTVVECCHSDVRQVDTLTITGSVKGAGLTCTNAAQYFARRYLGSFDDERKREQPSEGGAGASAADSDIHTAPARVRPCFYVNMSPNHVTKESSSIGSAVAVALISLAKGVPVDRDTVVAGEVRTEGEVFPMTSLSQEDLEYVYSSGVKRLFIPFRNAVEVKSLPNFDCTRLQVEGMRNLGEALPLILRGSGCQ